MKISATILLLFSCSQLWAQETIETDTASLEDMDNFHLYISASYAGQQFVETIASFASLSIGAVYKNKLDFNIYYSGILNDFKKQIIFPTLFAYEQSSLGCHFQYMFTEHKIRPLVGIGGQYSELTWRSEGDLNDVFTDHIFIYGAFAGGVWHINNTLTLQTDIGYSFPGDVKLVGFEKDDFQGFSFDLAIKIDVFSF